MNSIAGLCSACAVVILCSVSAQAETESAQTSVIEETSRKPEAEQLARGRYLVQMTGCNDCHTDGYAPSEGRIPDSEWLLGSNVGWRGPWGTTYPVNLRTYLSALTEEQWLRIAKTVKSRPPMPWWVLHEMADDDLKAIYTFVRSLPKNDQPVATYLSVDEEPKTPYFTLVVPEAVAEQP